MLRTVSTGARKSNLSTSELETRCAGVEDRGGMEPRGVAEEPDGRTTGAGLNDGHVPSPETQLASQNGCPRIVRATPDVFADGCEHRLRRQVNELKRGAVAFGAC